MLINTIEYKQEKGGDFMKKPKKINIDSTYEFLRFRLESPLLKIPSRHKKVIAGYIYLFKRVEELKEQTFSSDIDRYVEISADFNLYDIISLKLVDDYIKANSTQRLEVIERISNELQRLEYRIKEVKEIIIDGFKDCVVDLGLVCLGYYDDDDEC